VERTVILDLQISNLEQRISAARNLLKLTEEEISMVEEAESPPFLLFLSSLHNRSSSSSDPNFISAPT